MSVLAIDAGTTGVTALLVAADGSVAARGYEEFRQYYRDECSKANIDYVAMDTSVSFDKALLEYLIQRQRRF